MKVQSAVSVMPPGQAKVAGVPDHGTLYSVLTTSREDRYMLPLADPDLLQRMGKPNIRSCT